MLILYLPPSLRYALGPSSEACLLPRSSLAPPASLPRKGSVKAGAMGGQLPSKVPPASPLHLPKDYHRSLGDLKVGLPVKTEHHCTHCPAGVFNPGPQGTLSCMFRMFPSSQHI